MEIIYNEEAKRHECALENTTVHRPDGDVGFQSE